MHITDFKPIQGMQIAGNGYALFKEILQKKGLRVDFPKIRSTLHWCLGRVVPQIFVANNEAEASYLQRKYAIVTRLNNLYPQLLNLYIKDTITLGNYKLTDQDYVLIPEGEDPRPWNNAGVTIASAVDDLITSQGGVIITKNEDLTKDSELEEFVTIQGSNIVFNEQDPFIFNGILESLDNISFGRHDQSFKGGWITNYLCIQEMLFQEIYALFLLQNSDFFYHANREIYLETTQGILQCIKENLYKTICDSTRYSQELKEYFKLQQENLYTWVKFLEIEKHLYVNYQRTLTDPKDVTCIEYLLSNIHLNIAQLLCYVDEHYEKFQTLNDMFKKYDQLETRNFIQYYGLSIIPKVLLEDFMKEPLLKDNPGNVILFMMFKYDFFDDIENMLKLKLPEEIIVLLNLLNESCDKLLFNLDHSKDYYSKLNFRGLHPEVLKFLSKNGSSIRDYYAIITAPAQSEHESIPRPLATTESDNVFLVDYLLQHGYSDGYATLVQKGICYGFAKMSMQAMLTGDWDNFLNRLKIINKLVAKEPVALTKQTEIDIAAFLNGVISYQLSQHYKKDKILFDSNGFFKKCYFKHDFSLLKPGLFEEQKVSIYDVNKEVGCYKISELFSLLEIIEESIKAGINDKIIHIKFNQIIPVEFTNRKYSIMLGYDYSNDAWIVSNINTLYKTNYIEILNKLYRSKEDLIYALCGCFSKKILILMLK